MNTFFFKVQVATLIEYVSLGQRPKKKHVSGINLDIEGARATFAAYQKEGDAEGRRASPQLDRSRLPK
jgi:hypothetical protein